MKYELEIEMKNLLTEAEFHRLKQHFSFCPQDFILQTNYYFETSASDFKKRHWNLRMREKQSQFTLTLKQKADGHVNEYHLPLTPKEAQALLAGHGHKKITELLAAVHAEAFKPAYIGSLQTRRAQCRYRNGIICLDENHYFQQTDFEVEYEVKDRTDGEKIFAQLLQALSIQAKDTPSKIARFYTYQKQMERK